MTALKDGDMRLCCAITAQHETENNLRQTAVKIIQHHQRFDATGCRLMVQFSDGLTETRYLWHDGQQVVYEEVSGLTEPYRYVWGNGIDEALVRFGNGGIWYLDNQLGSVMGLTDSSGQIVERYSYDVYGAVTAYDSSGQQIPVTNYDNRYLFTGREYNWHTGLYHYRARTYHPYLGRFLSRDRFVLRGGWTNYQYADDCPTVKTDAYGLWSDHETLTKRKLVAYFGPRTLSLLVEANVSTDADALEYNMKWHYMRLRSTSPAKVIKDFEQALQKAWSLVLAGVQICMEGKQRLGRHDYEWGCIAVVIFGTFLHALQDAFAHFIPFDPYTPPAVVWRRRWKCPKTPKFRLNITGQHGQIFGALGWPMTMFQHGFRGEHTIAPSFVALVLGFLWWVDSVSSRSDCANSAVAQTDFFWRLLRQSLKAKGLTDRDIVCCFTYSFNLFVASGGNEGRKKNWLRMRDILCK